jgi:hypothetical protein
MIVGFFVLSPANPQPFAPEHRCRMQQAAALLRSIDWKHTSFGPIDAGQPDSTDSSSRLPSIVETTGSALAD